MEIQHGNGHHGGARIGCLRRMQHQRGPDSCPEMLGVGGNGQQGFCGDIEQQSVDGLLVLFDAQGHALAVDVAHLQDGHFIDAQAGRVG